MSTACHHRPAFVTWTRTLVCGALLFAAGAPALAGDSVGVPIQTFVPAQQGVGEADHGSSGGGHYTFGEIIRKSVFGPQPDPEHPWTPLTFRSLFSEGWFEPWTSPPGAAPGGSLRQGWIGTFDAFYNRMGVGIYSYTRGAHGGPDEHVGQFLFELPITRRWMIGGFIPFVDNLQGGPAGGSSSFGDITLENRFMLHETEGTSISFNLNVRIPTGDEKQGNDRTRLQPYLAYYFDLARGFSFRGATGLDIPVDDKAGDKDPVYFQSLAIGQTLLPHDVPLLGDFTYYLAGNLRQGLGDNNSTFVSLTPGIRTHLGHNFFFLAGLEVPVTGPRPFEERLTFVVVKGF